MEKEILGKRKKVVYDLICDTLYVPMKRKELSVFLQVEKEDRESFKEILDQLENEGKITLTKNRKYIKGKSSFIKGIYRANARGFGFVQVEGEDEEIFISKDYVNGAFHGDTVELILLPKSSGKRKEGKILSVIERGILRIVGYYQKSKNFGFVLPDNQKFLQDIFVPREKENGACSGQKVVVELISYGTKERSPEGKIIEVLGNAKDAGVDILSLVKDHEIKVEFPQKVINQAERVAQEVSQADMQGREDMRHLQTVTIDGEDAKDLDDAISLERQGDFFVLGVHIADVVNYVQEKSALDREARRRGTSVYLVDRVIPMLPRTLSNGICSLNAGEDRLALSCMMTIDEIGNVVDHRICESVIHVDKRMSYTQVSKMLSGEETKENKTYAPFAEMLAQMRELMQILKEKRNKRGAINFDFPETKVILNEAGEPTEIKPYERTFASSIIEEFMLLANETVAEDFFWRELPFVYRNHEAPEEEKIRKLAVFINNFGYNIRIKDNEIRPKEIQSLLSKIEGTKEEILLTRLTLRSMNRARYEKECKGHFGLAASYYSHFTSPIRRYPDLQIHRIIKESIRGKMSEERIEHYEKILPEVAKETSVAERKAEEAERDSIKLKMAQYMQSRIGEEFDGVISSITKWGMYVELENTIEGLVHVVNMKDDHYEYYEESYEMRSVSSGKCYKLGESIRIRVIGVDTLNHTIDFELATGGDTWQKQKES